jgi:hypothetical protein
MTRYFCSARLSILHPAALMGLSGAPDRTTVAQRQKLYKGTVRQAFFVFILVWAHFRRTAPETGLSGVPLRSIPGAGIRLRRERPSGSPLQSLARPNTLRVFGLGVSLRETPENDSPMGTKFSPGLWIPLHLA